MFESQLKLARPEREVLKPKAYLVSPRSRRATRDERRQAGGEESAMAEESDVALNEGAAEAQGGGENVEEEEKEVAVDELTKIFNNYKSDVKVSRPNRTQQRSEGKEG